MRPESLSNRPEPISTLRRAASVGGTSMPDWKSCGMLVRYFRPASLDSWYSVIAVRTRPGSIAKTSTPVPASESETHSVKRRRPALLVAEPDPWGKEVAVPPPTVLMMRPRRLASIAGIATRQQLKVPRILVSTSRHQASGSTVQIGPIAAKAPALFVTRLTGPRLRSIAANALVTDSRSV